MIIPCSSLAEYLTLLQIKGRFTFTREEALASLQITPNAFKLAALRLIKKNQLVRLKKGFYTVVPTEYQGVGAPPASWYINNLMKYSEQDYYVGLLSAAALYGAAHQQPQVFQVITNKASRQMIVGRARIQFLFKKIINPTVYQSVKTPTGYMNVSLPEMTAVDLVQYVKSAGYLNNVLTVLSELQEQLDPNRFKELLINQDIDLAYLQRLGYLLEVAEASSDIITLLKNWIRKKAPHFSPLRAGKKHAGSPKNNDWCLYINEEVESDL